MGVYRRDDTWWVSLTREGHRIRKYGGRTRKEAETTLAKIRLDLE